MKTTFIYALKELKDGEFFSTKIRYIGKANDPYRRFEQHCVCKEKTHLGNWIRSLPGRGLSLQLEVLDEIPEAEWAFWEREYIRVFRAIGFNLVNSTDGGDGVTMTQETRAKLSAAGRGKQTRLGKKHSRETRAKLSAANRGKKPSPETRAKLSAANTGKKPSPETRAKIGAGNRGKKRSPEIRAKMSAALTGHKVSPEARAKLSAANTGKKHSPETRAKISAAKQGKRGKTPSLETRAKISATKKLRWVKRIWLTP